MTIAEVVLEGQGNPPNPIPFGLQERARKIVDVDLLPIFDDARDFILYANSSNLPNSILLVKLLREHGIYAIYNVEFVDALAEEIRALGECPIIEVCAGNGKLSYHLRKKGIDIKATDNYSNNFPRDENLVERLSHIEALRKYQPRIVVGAWLPNAQVPYEVFDYPTVQHFIDIGKFDCTWSFEQLGRNTFGVVDNSKDGRFVEGPESKAIAGADDVVSRIDFTKKELEKVVRFGLSHLTGFEVYHPIVNLFTRTIQ